MLTGIDIGAKEVYRYPHYSEKAKLTHLVIPFISYTCSEHFKYLSCVVYHVVGVLFMNIFMSVPDGRYCAHGDKTLGLPIEWLPSRSIRYMISFIACIVAVIIAGPGRADRVRWFERGSQVVPQLRNGLVKWDGKKNCLQLSLKSGPGISYAKEALFLPSIRPFYTTLSLTARTASDKSVDEVTIQFSDREAMIEAYDFLKNFLAVKSPYDRLPSKSRGLYQNTTPLRHTPSLAVGQTMLLQSVCRAGEGLEKNVRGEIEVWQVSVLYGLNVKLGVLYVEKVELMPSEKPGRIVVTEKADEAKLHEEFRTSSMSNDFADESSLYHTPCSTKRDSNQQKSQRMIRPTLTEIARQGQSKMRKHKVMPAEQLSSPPSTGFRRRISDVNEALLCSSQSPVKSTVKKSSLVLPLSPKQEPRNHGGFANLGATCYMNAVLQAILNVETFAKELFKTWQRCKKISEKNGISVQGIELISALSILASHRLLATEVQNKRLLKGVMGAVRSSTFSESRQEDAQEFMAQVFDQLSDECETVSREFPIKENNGQVAQNFVESNFMFALQNDIICESCGHTDTRCEESTSLPIDFEQSYFRSTDLRKKKIVSLQTMLDYCLRNEQVEHRCDVCGSVNAEIRRKFRKLPRCLVMYLKRYTLDAEKRTDSVDIPRFVTLDGHCAPLVEPFTQLPPSTEKGELFSLSPLQGGEQRSPQMQQTPQCRESYAEVKNNAAQNSRQSVADDKLGSLSGNRRSAEPSWRRSHRKSNAIPRRLWSAAREDSADLAHAGGILVI
ncbi:unnamed protein product [Toxocara canis]|uniref:USP domain-containing protein n=1 Tax=Toxocara canis TaxID=6265 RepID=A0A183URH2_TOXCA|nr:unnamed protein product [Toxocara canis]